MNNLKKTFRFDKMVFAFVLLALWIPSIQKETQWVEEKPLKGAITQLDFPDFYFFDWFSGTYQEAMNRYVDHNLGFRNTFVRLHNQILYTFFNEVRAQGVVLGQEEYLYEENYILSYLGLNHVGEEKIKADVTKLRRVVDTLHQLNTSLIFALAPGKGYFFPEYFPYQYQNIKKQIGNYETYTDAFKQQGIPYIDFNSWFVQMKKTSPYPLYGQGGIHWSTYGASLATDSLIRFIEDVRPCRLNHLKTGTIIVEENNSEDDNDIGLALNLFSTLTTYPMAYPQFHFEKDKEAVKPKMICVSDSYSWFLLHSGFMKEVFEGGKFWYYNEIIQPSEGLISTKVSELSLQEEIEKQDVVLILITETNLSRFTFGFIDQLYDLYYPNSEK